jgi:hypothetical protein
MSNTRKLRPHELAKRDQLAADAMARLRRGEVVSWVDLAPPDLQCSWCDCPLTPDSPHHRRGYVCSHLCHAEASYVAIMLSAPRPVPIPLCERHLPDWQDVTVALLQPVRAEILGPWMDAD